MKLRDKVAIITGGGKGIGRTIALAFAREGADISLAARSTDLMEEVALEIRALGRKALAVTTDIKKVEQVKKMVERTFEKFGRIDILVNNSGIAGPTAYVHEITPEEWDETFDVNLEVLLGVGVLVVKDRLGELPSRLRVEAQEPQPAVEEHRPAGDAVEHVILH